MRDRRGDLGLKNELVTFRFHNRPQAVLDRLGYSLCEYHSNRFWSNPHDAMKEWHIALQNYEEACTEKDDKRTNFAALAFQMSRISILRCDDTDHDVAYFFSTVLLLIEEFEAMGEAEGACAVLLEALTIISDLEDVSFRADRDYELLSANLVAASQVIHRRYNKPKHLRLVYSKPAKVTRN